MYILKEWISFSWKMFLWVNLILVLFFIVRWWLLDRVFWYETSIWPAGTDFTIWLHGKIEFHPCKADQVSDLHLFRLVYILFNFPLQACIKLFFSTTWARGQRNLYPSKVTSQQFKRGIPSNPDRTFYWYL